MPDKPRTASVEEAVAAVRDGRMIIIVDDEDRENEGDLMVAADKATPEAVNFMARHGRGLICLPLTLADPLGGHLMSGQVDFTAKTVRVTPKRPGRRLAFGLPAAFRKFLVAKGSVGVNGVSLTVASLGPSRFEVELIPATLDKSNLSALRAGDPVNVECDMIGKYVYNFTSGRSARSGSD